MTNYQNSKTYKITSGQTENIYIGSTTQKLNKRLSEHISNYDKYLNGNKIYCSSYEILKHDDYKIELIQNYPCENKNDLLKKEQECIDLYKDICVNNRKAYTGIDTNLSIQEYKKQHYQLNKEKISERRKEYYINNKDKIVEYKKQYRQNNRDKLLEKNKQYYQDNREKIAEKQKQNYENNRDKILEKRKEKITCECGSIVFKNNLSRHKKSKKHINFINNN